MTSSLTTSPTPFLEEILSQAAEIVQTPHGYLYLVDPAIDRMVIRTAIGVFATFSHRPLARGEGIAGRVWESGEPLVIDSYRQWEGRLPERDRDVLRGIAGIPLTIGGETVGVIGLAFTDDRHFSKRDIRHLERFARFASLAMDHALTRTRLDAELGIRRRIQESLRLMERIVEQAPVSIVITDPRGVIEYVNPRFCELTGYAPHEAVGKTPAFLKSGRTTPDEYRTLWEMITSGGVWRGEFQNIRKDGSLFHERAMISPLSDDEGNITHFIGIKEDITQERSLENQLRHAQKMEAVGRIAAGVAHDFNNILTAIIGYANIVQMNLPADSPLTLPLDKIIASAGRGAELTRGLLTFSRKQTSTPQIFDLNDLVRRSRDLVERVATERIRVVVSPSSQPLPVRADRHELEQVIMNLVDNARDAIEGAGTITIETGEQTIDTDFIRDQKFGAPGRFALLRVTDTGVGIPPEHLESIFEPFFSTKEPGKGSGLGLAITYGIVKTHRGFIRADSRPGEGTAFSILLPLQTEREFRTENAERRVAPTSSPSFILFAEDDPTTRSVTRELLETFGYQVIAAENGTEAFEQYALYRDRIGMLLLDAVMPGMGGEDLIRRIREIDPDQRIILSSGYGEEGVSPEMKESPRLFFLPKPYTPRELLAMVRRVERNG
ncbi:MAG: hypothetical protein Fur0034_03180 [Desulfuromonadia bacterium]